MKQLSIESTASLDVREHDYESTADVTIEDKVKYRFPSPSVDENDNVTTTTVNCSPFSTPQRDHCHCNDENDGVDCAEKKQEAVTLLSLSYAKDDVVKANLSSAKIATSNSKKGLLRRLLASRRTRKRSTQIIASHSDERTSKGDSGALETDTENVEQIEVLHIETDGEDDDDILHSGVEDSDTEAVKMPVIQNMEQPPLEDDETDHGTNGVNTTTGNVDADDDQQVSQKSSIGSVKNMEGVAEDNNILQADDSNVMVRLLREENAHLNLLYTDCAKQLVEFKEHVTAYEAKHEEMQHELSAGLLEKESFHNVYQAVVQRCQKLEKKLDTSETLIKALEKERENYHGSLQSNSRPYYQKLIKEGHLFMSQGLPSSEHVEEKLEDCVKLLESLKIQREVLRSEIDCKYSSDRLLTKELKAKREEMKKIEASLIPLLVRIEERKEMLAHDYITKLTHEKHCNSKELEDQTRIVLEKIEEQARLKAELAMLLSTTQKMKHAMDDAQSNIASLEQERKDYARLEATLLRLATDQKKQEGKLQKLDELRNNVQALKSQIVCLEAEKHELQQQNIEQENKYCKLISDKEVEAQILVDDRDSALEKVAEMQYAVNFQDERFQRDKEINTEELHQVTSERNSALQKIDKLQAMIERKEDQYQQSLRTQSIANEALMKEKDTKIATTTQELSTLIQKVEDDSLVMRHLRRRAEDLETENMVRNTAQFEECKVLQSKLVALEEILHVKDADLLAMVKQQTLKEAVIEKLTKTQDERFLIVKEDLRTLRTEYVVLQERLAGRDATIAETTEELRSVTSKLIESQNVLVVREAELQKIGSETGKLQNLTNASKIAHSATLEELKDVHVRLTETNEKLADNEEEIRKLYEKVLSCQNQLFERDARIALANEKLRTTEMLYQDNQKELAAQDAANALAHLDLQAADSKNSELESQVKEQNTLSSEMAKELQSIKARNEENVKLLENRESMLVSTSEALHSTKNELVELQHHASQVEAELQKVMNLADERLTLLSDRGATIAKLGEKLHEMETKCSESQKEVLDRSDELRAIDAKVAVLQNIVTQRDGVISALSEELRVSKAKQIGNEKLIMEKDITIASIRESLRMIEYQDSEKQKVIETLDTEIASLKLEMHEMKDRENESQKLLVDRNMEVFQLGEWLCNVLSENETNKNRLNEQGDAIAEKMTELRTAYRELTVAREYIKTQDATITTMKEEIQSIMERNDEIKNVVRHRDDCITALSDEVQAQKTNNEELVDLLSNRDAEIALTKEELCSTEAQNTQLRQMMKDRDATIAEKILAVFELEVEASELSKMGRDKDEAIATKTEELCGALGQVSELQNELKEKNADISNAAARMDALTEEISEQRKLVLIGVEKLQTTTKTKDNELVTAEKKICELSRALDTSKVELRQLQKDKSVLMEEIENAQRRKVLAEHAEALRISQLEKDLAFANTSIEALQIERDGLKANIAHATERKEQAIAATKKKMRELEESIPESESSLMVLEVVKKDEVGTEINETIAMLRESVKEMQAEKDALAKQIDDIDVSVTHEQQETESVLARLDEELCKRRDMALQLKREREKLIWVKEHRLDVSAESLARLAIEEESLNVDDIDNVGLTHGRSDAKVANVAEREREVQGLRVLVQTPELENDAISQLTTDHL